MPEKPTTEQSAERDGPEWQVWLASTQPIDVKGGGRLAALGCVAFLLGLYLFLLFLGFAARALYQGQGAVLLWLAAGHLPLVWLIGTLVRFYREPSPRSEPPPTEGRRTGLACLLDDAGIRHGEDRLHLWQDIAGYAYDSADGSAFAIRLWFRSSSRARQPRRSALHAFAVLTPAGVTLLSLFVGWHRFGARDDVKAALCVAGLHLLIAIPIALSFLGDARKARGKSYDTTDVLFDSRHVTAVEAMERLSRLVPYGVPADIDGGNS